MSGKIKIKGKAPFVIISFINWYMNRYKISHEITLIFDDVYGVYDSGKKVIDLNLVTSEIGVALGTFSFNTNPNLDPDLEITLYTKSHELIKKYHPHLPYTLLYTFVHEMVHYEQFRDIGDVNHKGIDARTEHLIKEFYS